MSAGRELAGGPVGGAWEIPRRRAHEGRTVRLEPVEPSRHAAELFAATHGADRDDRLWDYLGYGPFESEPAFADWLVGCAASEDPLFFAFRTAHDGLASGMGAMMRIEPAHGVGEIGNIWFSPRMQRTTASTEALHLMMRHLLGDLGYRRLEWKCNALNDASRRSAARLGFTFEGVFYQHMVIKGRNRDTAWFSLLDHEWPRADAAFGRWLDPANFDTDGTQRQPLAAAAP